MGSLEGAQQHHAAKQERIERDAGVRAVDVSRKWEKFKAGKQTHGQYILSRAAYVAQICAEFSKFRTEDFIPNLQYRKDLITALQKANFFHEELETALLAEYKSAVAQLKVEGLDVSSATKNELPRRLDAEMQKAEAELNGLILEVAGKMQKFIASNDGHDMLTMLSEFKEDDYKLLDTNAGEDVARKTISSKNILDAGYVIDGSLQFLMPLANPDTAVTSLGLHERFITAEAHLKNALTQMRAVLAELTVPRLTALKTQIRDRYTKMIEELPPMKRAERAAKRAELLEERKKWEAKVDMLRALRENMVVARDNIKDLIILVQEVNDLNRDIDGAHIALRTAKEVRELPERLVTLFARQIEHIEKVRAKGVVGLDSHVSAYSRKRIPEGQEFLIGVLKGYEAYWQEGAEDHGAPKKEEPLKRAA